MMGREPDIQLYRVRDKKTGLWYIGRWKPDVEWGGQVFNTYAGAERVAEREKNGEVVGYHCYEVEE